MFSGVTQEEVFAIVDEVVRNLLAQVGVTGPPVNAMAVARRLGVTIAVDDRQEGRTRLVRLRGPQGRAPRPTILLRSGQRLERQQWAVAHELGQSAAVYVFDALAIDPREASKEAREAVAKRLAGRMLLPSDWFGPDAVACGWDLLALKRRYSTASHELIARRMLELAEPVIISVFDRGGLSWRRSNVAGLVPGPSELETKCWRTAHQESRPERALEGPRVIQAWPVHEPQWKREILRTEIELQAAG